MLSDRVDQRNTYHCCCCCRKACTEELHYNIVVDKKKTTLSGRVVSSGLDWMSLQYNTHFHWNTLGSLQNGNLKDKMWYDVHTEFCLRFSWFSLNSISNFYQILLGLIVSSHKVGMMIQKL